MAIHRFHSYLSVVGEPDHRDVGDGELVQALIEEAPWAQVELWNRFAPLVFGMAARTLGSEIDAEDVVQEVFYRVLAKISMLRDVGKLHSFVVSFAIRIVRWELRRKRARGWLSFHEPEALVDLAFDTQDVESRDLTRRFYELLSRLPAQERLAFSLRHMESMTIEQIAEAMQISVSSVKRYEGRATERMARWIETNPELASLLAGKRGRDELERR